MSRHETNARLRDPITVRSTSSRLSTYYYYSFGLFWIIFYPFPIIKLSPFYLITSSVPTCLVHNCEASQRLFCSHLLSPLSQDQIPFDPPSSGAHCEVSFRFLRELSSLPHCLLILLHAFPIKHLIKWLTTLITLPERIFL